MEGLTCSTQIPKVGTYSQKSCWKMCFLSHLKKVSVLIRALRSSQASLLLPASVRRGAGLHPPLGSGGAWGSDWLYRWYPHPGVELAGAGRCRGWCPRYVAGRTSALFLGSSPGTKPLPLSQLGGTDVPGF